MANPKAKPQSKPAQPAVITTNAPLGVSTNSGLPANVATGNPFATMAATLTTQAQATPAKVAPAARLQAMQQAGLAAQGATALAHKAGPATYGKLRAGSYGINPAKATTLSKTGFNAQAWAAIVAAVNTAGGPCFASTLANSIITATGCAGTVATAHVAYRIKQGWLVAA